MRKSFAFQYLLAFEPKLYRRYQLVKRIARWTEFVGLPVVVALSIAVNEQFGNPKQPGALEHFIPILVLVVVPIVGLLLIPTIYILAIIWAWLYDRSIADRERILMNEKTKTHYSAEREHGAKLLTEFQARAIGANIIAEQGATVYNNSFNNATIVDRSTLIHSMNQVENDVELADALKVVAGIVQNSNNATAIETLNEFNKKIAAKESKITLRALWEQVVKLVPTVVEIGGAASKIIGWLNQPPGSGSV